MVATHEHAHAQTRARTNARRRARTHETHTARVHKRWRCMLFFIPVSAKKRFLFYSVLMLCSHPLPHVFNVDEITVQVCPRRKGIFFRRRHATLSSQHQLWREGGRVENTLAMRCQWELFFADTGTFKKGVGCAECVRPVSSRMCNRHVHSWQRAANMYKHLSTRVRMHDVRKSYKPHEHLTMRLHLNRFVCIIRIPF